MTTIEANNDGDVRARWIRTSVEVFDHDIFAGDTFSRRDAWLWLIANAAWKPRRFRLSGSNKFVELRRGQVLAARGYLAEVWGWGEKQVRNFVHLLEKENMIKMDQSKGRFANVVTICNYEKYQTANSDKGQLQGRLEASYGPVEGQTLTSITNSTSKSEGAREGEVAHAHGVFVNCETIRHAAFTISLPSIEMATVASGLPQPEIKNICLAHAMQWAAEIEGGKLSRDVVPSKIANFLSSTIMREKARGASVAPSSAQRGAPLSSGAAWHEERRRKTQIIMALAKGEALPQ